MVKFLAISVSCFSHVVRCDHRSFSLIFRMASVVVVLIIITSLSRHILCVEQFFCFFVFLFFYFLKIYGREKLERNAKQEGLREGGRERENVGVERCL